MKQQTAIDTHSIAAEQITKDIDFLSERVRFMRQQAKPNLVVLHTYESMLEKRLKMLQSISPENLHHRHSSSGNA